MASSEVFMLAFTRLSLARQYLLVSFLILFCGMLIIGAWVGRQIEIGVMNLLVIQRYMWIVWFPPSKYLYLKQPGSF